MTRLIIILLTTFIYLANTGANAAPVAGGEGRGIDGQTLQSPSYRVTATGSEAQMSEPSVPTAISGMVYSTTALELFWERSTSDEPVVAYEVYRDGELTGFAEGNSYFEEGLLPDTAYNYALLAIDNGGDRSGVSTEYSITTRSLNPAVPSPTGLFGAVYGPNFIEVFWDRMSDPGFRYSVSVNGAEVTETDGTSWLSMELSDDTSYTIAVATLDSVGNLSEPVSVTLVTPDSELSNEQPGESDVPLDAELDTAALDTLASLNARSATFAISVDGQTLYTSAYGDLTDANIPMAMASLSKPVTAYIILKMQEDGFLSIYDPIGRYVPEIAELELGSLIIDKPLVDFLSHRSGLVHQLSYGFSDWKARLENVLSAGLLSGHSYANDNYTLLTRVVMNTLGSYQAALDTYINIDGIESFRIGSYHGIPSFAGAAELEASAADYFAFTQKAAPTSVLQGDGYGYAWQHSDDGYLYHTGWHFGVPGGDRNAASVWNATAASGRNVSFVFFAIGSDTFGAIVSQLLTTL